MSHDLGYCRLRCFIPASRITHGTSVPGHRCTLPPGIQSIAGCATLTIAMFQQPLEQHRIDPAEEAFAPVNDHHGN